LRERVELVESILKGNSAQLDNMVSSNVKTKVEKSNTEYGRFGGRSSFKKKMNSQNQPVEDESEPVTVDGVYNELIHLRKMNRALGDRIKQLEVQNFNMTAQGFNMVKKKHQEPNRPIFSFSDQGD